MLPLRAAVCAAIRSYLLADANLVALLEHTPEANKITIDQTTDNVDSPFVNLTTLRGGRVNNDPRPDFDLYMTAKVMGKDLRQLYSIYGQIEMLLADAQLPDGFGLTFYVPVRAVDASYFETFKVAQVDLYRIGGTFRVRGLHGD